MNEPVTSIATDTTLDINVTSAYGGSGAAVNHSTASVSATIKNLSQADDIWYQIGGGAFVQLTERQSVDITINFASQTLKLKRGENTSSSIPVQVIAYGVPSGTYARGQALAGGSGITEEGLPAALAALGVYATGLKVAITDVPKAAILALHTTGYPIIPAQGANKVPWMIRGSAYPVGNVAYDGGGRLSTYYAGDGQQIYFGNAGTGDHLPGNVLSASAGNAGTFGEFGPRSAFAGDNQCTTQALNFNKGVVIKSSVAYTEVTDGITGFTINAAGADFLAGEVVSRDDYLATFVITSVNGGGGITGLRMLSGGGGGYSIASGVPLVQGSGTGATINVTSVGPSDMVLRVVSLYVVIDYTP